MLEFLMQKENIAMPILITLKVSKLEKSHLTKKNNKIKLKQNTKKQSVRYVLPDSMLTFRLSQENHIYRSGSSCVA